MTSNIDKISMVSVHCLVSHMSATYIYQIELIYIEMAIYNGAIHVCLLVFIHISPTSLSTIHLN